MTFKEGDKIIMTENCSGLRKGDICILEFQRLKENDPFHLFEERSLFAYQIGENSNNRGCSHRVYWKRLRPMTKQEMLEEIKTNLSI